jgi:hypothetical protein
MDNQPTSNKQGHKCIGMGDSGMTNLSERVDELLYADHQAPSPIKKRRVGILKGTFVLPLPDDFDETLADFQEYL